MTNILDSIATDGGDWRIRLAAGIGTVAGVTVAFLVRHDFGSFWLGLFWFALVTGLGGVLGHYVRLLLFGQSY